MMQWVRRALDQSTREHAGDPGPVALRRLTAAEYGYSIEDLTGLKIDFSHLLVDEAVGGEGFSNIGNVQNALSGPVLDKYLAMADEVAQHARFDQLDIGQRSE